MTLEHRLRAAATKHWPIKLTALVLSALLWAVTAAEEPTTQLVPVSLQVELPDGRALRQRLPPVQALYAGSTRELIKLYAQPPVIRKVVPDTATGSEWTVELAPGDLVLAVEAVVQAQDVQPRSVRLVIDDLAQRTVPVESRITVRPDSGFVLTRAVLLQPAVVQLGGPRAEVESISRVYTLPLEVATSRSLRRRVQIDTTGLGLVTLSTPTVEVDIEVSRAIERVIMGVPVRVAGNRSGRFIADPPAIAVSVRGPELQVNRITRDSLVVTAEPGAGQRAVVPVSVQPIPGLELMSTPDSVVIERTAGS